jgi:16S rRNA (guanine527-N7)-methyltransferase
MRDEFVAAVKTHQPAFGLSLNDSQIEGLAEFYRLVQEHNEILHLVAPMPAEEFAIRHILESLTMLEYLPEGTRFADVGAGAGLPSIPCLIARADLKAVLIESKIRKADHLTKAVSDLGMSDRAKVVNLQFEEAKAEQFAVVACRALDKFTQKLPHLVKWSQRRTLLLFGGPALREALRDQKLEFIEKLMPMSEQRYLFVVKR